MGVVIGFGADISWGEKPRPDANRMCPLVIGSYRGSLPTARTNALCGYDDNQGAALATPVPPLRSVIRVRRAQDSGSDPAIFHEPGNPSQIFTAEVSRLGECT